MYVVIGFRRREGVRGYRVQGLHYLHKSRVIHVNLTVRTVYRGFHILGGWNRGVATVHRGVLISGCWNRGVPLYRDVFISGCWRCPVFHFRCWNRGVPLYTEVSSFQYVGIEEFHCIQRCPHFRVLE